MGKNWACLAAASLLALFAPGAAWARDDSAAQDRWLLIESVPAGATVIVDESFDGTAPFRTLIAPGEHEVRIGQKGYITQSREVVVPVDEDVTLSVVLEPDPEDTYVSTGNVVFWGGIGAGAALAGLGHWGASDTADTMRAGDLSARDANRAYSAVALTGYAVAVGSAVLGAILWNTPKRYRTGYVCYEMEQTGSRVPQRVCKSK